MGATSIEWTDHSINPIRARFWASTGHYCVKVSPGCKNCYSSRMQPRFGLPQFQDQRKDGAIEPFLDATKLADVLRRRAPTKWFWCDMTDMFGEWVPDEWIAACWATMLLTPHHTHQVLTKRPERMRALLTSEAFYSKVLTAANRGPRRARPELTGIGISDPAKFPAGWIWIGVSVEDQQRAKERIPLLMETPAAVRFISAEPLLGAIDLRQLGPWTDGGKHAGCPLEVYPLIGTMAIPDCDIESGRLDWVIVGAESGRGARPMDIDWARALRDQCTTAGVPFFLKQFADDKGHKISTPELDGRRWVEFPESHRRPR
jgi:protein gp37